ncbi:hypothetical protein FOCC_FOCC011963 [Frankliniella occidentalis]|nr:hypothetical protein FOCC_FOCC011963 [Frankliniella occidentalis]
MDLGEGNFVNSYINEWSVLTHPSGHELILQDFSLLYPNSENGLFLHWDHFLNVTGEIARLDVKDKLAKKKLLQLLQQDSNLTLNDRASLLLYVLPAVRAGHTTKVDGKQKRITIEQARGSFLVYAKAASDVKNVVSAQRQLLLSSSGVKKAASPQTAEPGGGQGASYGWRDPNTTASEVRQPTTPGNQVTVSVEDSTSHIKGQKKMEETWELDFIGLVLSAGDLRMQELVRHPLVASFLDLKWQLVKRIYIFFNLLSHLIFSVGVTVYATFREFKKVLVIASLEETPKSVLIGVVFIYAIVECVRVSQRFKLFIRFFGWRKLVSSLQDWMAISSIVVTSVMLATDSTNVYLRRQLAAVCVLTTWIRHILIWAPISQQLATSIVMVKRVSWQCFKVLRNYGILIVAFALSFYILFHNCPIDGTGPDCPDDETGDDEFFRNPAKSIFKSFVMLTGEFDASSLPFDSFPVTSHILFLLFVFLVSIVLFNLILGLALSDTQAIRQEAELWAHVLRAEHLLFSKFALARWWSERLPSIMLFSRDKRERRIRVLPSDGNRVTYPMEKSSKLYKYLHTLRMDSDIMRKVNELLLERKSQSNVN